MFWSARRLYNFIHGIQIAILDYLDFHIITILFLFCLLSGVGLLALDLLRRGGFLGCRQLLVLLLLRRVLVVVGAAIATWARVRDVLAGYLEGIFEPLECGECLLSLVFASARTRSHLLSWVR